MNSRIIGTGGYLPKKALTNHDLEQIVETSDTWIKERTGIHQRHIASEGELTSDLAYHAAVDALKAANIGADDLDMIILATTTPDKIFPSTACRVQQRLQTSGQPAFDIQAVCSGFVYALSLADNAIRAGSAKRVLVIGAETLSRIVDWNDRGTCVLFGDGAGAVVLEASEKPGILSTHLHADGAYETLLHVPDKVIHMAGNEVFKMAVNTLGQIVDETLEHNQKTREDIDWLVPHQANIRIIKATAKKLKMDMNHVIVTVDQHGNTSAASIPLALNHAVKDGRIQAGHTILLEAFGGGFTWGSALVTM
jgi:3-oxoacyl-[acyl-carrier-protein] synthase III